MYILQHGTLEAGWFGSAFRMPDMEKLWRQAEAERGDVFGRNVTFIFPEGIPGNEQAVPAITIRDICDFNPDQIDNPDLAMQGYGNDHEDAAEILGMDRDEIMNDLESEYDMAYI